MIIIIVVSDEARCIALLHFRFFDFIELINPDISMQTHVSNVHVCYLFVLLAQFL